jgi:Fur family transcriptional regulator, ferric uptake regulator
MEENLFRKLLEERGWRLTKQRNAILQKAFSYKGHFDPESLYLAMREQGMKASRASVYRTLNLLCECGLVEKVGKTEQGTIYEQSVDRKHHDHMVCIKCGEIIEFYSEKIEKLQQKICRELDFTGKNHTLEIRGYCRHCQMVQNVLEGDGSHGY